MPLTPARRRRKTGSFGLRYIPTERVPVASGGPFPKSPRLFLSSYSAENKQISTSWPTIRSPGIRSLLSMHHQRSRAPGLFQRAHKHKAFAASLAVQTFHCPGRRRRFRYFISRPCLFLLPRSLSDRSCICNRVRRLDLSPSWFPETVLRRQSRGPRTRCPIPLQAKPAPTV